MEKFQVDELSLPKQKPKNNQTVIGGNGNYDTVIVRETQVSQIPANNKQGNGDTNDSFLFHCQDATNGNQNSA